MQEIKRHVSSLLSALKNGLTPGNTDASPVPGRKIFCIGRNKTGTTSLQKALADLGYILGDQARAELLIDDYKARRFARLIEYCSTAQAFQDIPFSLPYTFITMDQAFPGSKFILTIRDSAEQWYQSLTRFHSKLFGNGTIPTRWDLENAAYRHRGYMWKAMLVAHDAPENDLYNKEALIKSYEHHNDSVLGYFRFRKDDLLVINPSDKDSYARLCDFLEKKPLYEHFPWENKSSG